MPVIGALTLRSSRARLCGPVCRVMMAVRSLPADDVEDDAGQIVDEGAKAGLSRVTPVCAISTGAVRWRRAA